MTTERRGGKESEAIFLTAGWVAEKWFCETTKTLPNGYEYLEEDKQSFMELMGVQGDNFVALWHEYCSGKTLKLVKSNWRAVQLVAHALMKQKHHVLAAKQIVNLLR